MSKTTLVRLNLAQIHLLQELIARQEGSGVYWGNRKHFQERLQTTYLRLVEGKTQLESPE